MYQDTPCKSQQALSKQETLTEVINRIESLSRELRNRAESINGQLFGEPSKNNSGEVAREIGIYSTIFRYEAQIAGEILQGAIGTLNQILSKITQ
jgi:hypothetical protein